MNTHMERDLRFRGSASHDNGEPLSRNTKLALLSAVVIAAFFVLREHWNHVLGLGPYLLLLLCPLMHLLGHGHHHHRRDDDRRA